MKSIKRDERQSLSSYVVLSKYDALNVVNTNPTSSSHHDHDNSKIEEDERLYYFAWLHFDDVIEAQAYSHICMARGTIVSSQIFLSAALLYFASVEAGCIDTSNNEIIENCRNRVHGFLPSSLISNVALAAGLLAALTMPVIGAIIDYTPHRKLVGVLGAMGIILIQAVQIGTLQNTWYLVAILQAFTGFLYEIQILTNYAYLPTIARIVGEKQMTDFTSLFYIIQFGTQLLFLILITIISSVFMFDDVVTSHLSQFLCTIWTTIHFWNGWYHMPHVPLAHQLSKKEAAQNANSLLIQGFKKVWRTTQNVRTNYTKGLKWFLLGIVFSQSGVQSFSILYVIYLNNVLGMTATEMGMVFFLTGLSALPGSKLGGYITNATNPNTSMKLSLMAFMIVSIGGPFLIDRPERSHYAYLFGIIVGITLGWYFPTEITFFSLCLPQGQEAELSGFYIYCSHILAWSPLLVFTIMNEIGIHEKWGLMSLSIPLLIAVLLLSCTSSWEEILQEAASTR